MHFPSLGFASVGCEVTCCLDAGRSVTSVDADKALEFLFVGSLCQGSGGYRYSKGWSWACGGCLGPPGLGGWE